MPYFRRQSDWAKLLKSLSMLAIGGMRTMSGNGRDQAMIPGWITNWGRRNFAYTIFVIILIPLANILEVSGPSGPDSGGGIMFGLIVWALVSFVFFLVNAILLIVALIKERNAMKPFIGCLLPVIVVVATLLAEELWLS
jgi:hypothetical protein